MFNFLSLAPRAGSKHDKEPGSRYECKDVVDVTDPERIQPLTKPGLKIRDEKPGMTFPIKKRIYTELDIQKGSQKNNG